MMEAAMTSETLVKSTRLHGGTTQKTAIFALTAVRTSNPTKYKALTKKDRSGTWNKNCKEKRKEEGREKQEDSNK
jgi:hypothetical protein